MLSFLFLRYLSGNYEESAKKELGVDYPQLSNSEKDTPLASWYEDNEDDVPNTRKDGRDLLRRIKLPCFLAPACGKLSN
jgi:type I restriction enzyme M protein